MFGLKRYNYDTFTKDLLIKDAMKSKFGRGPEPGESAPDLEGRTLDGGKVRLKHLKGSKNVVLTFGSATCPFSAASIEGLNELYDDYAGDDVEFLLVYVREAHPGEKLGRHQSFDDKKEAAERFRAEERVKIPILVDDLNGKIHRRYGGLPNPTYIIDKSGRVAFRALWTRPNVIEEALDELLERQQERDTEHAIVHGGEDTSMPLTFAMFHAHRALDRGGSKAIADFRRELGVPGRIVLTAGQVVEPIALYPGRAIAAVLIAGGVITAGLLLGRRLRQKRYAGLRNPYQFETTRRAQNREDDYAVGI
ncbi:MAG: peroxiredoxin family protein [Terriglobales bacterium]